jgi:hypothetical protein
MARPLEKRSKEKNEHSMELISYRVKNMCTNKEKPERKV